MEVIEKNIGRRLFLKSSTLAGGGMLLGFSWVVSCRDKPNGLDGKQPAERTILNGYIKIDADGKVTIMSPNPEGGQNVKTSMPMIIAEELDVDWGDVQVEQAPLDTTRFTRQFIGGSQAIRQGWESLRTAGATARMMLLSAAAAEWQIDISEVRSEAGHAVHTTSGRKLGYGELASKAAELPVPESVELKDPKDFTIIGKSKKNVDGMSIVTGRPLFGLDTYREGMLTAMIIHPPAFGMKLGNYDANGIKEMPGIQDVFTQKTYQEDYQWQYFDTNSFLELIVIVGNSTWEVLQAKRKLEPMVQWERSPDLEVVRDRFGTQQTLMFPSGLENTARHKELMGELSRKKGSLQRRDGNPEQVFATTGNILERSYMAPFLAHNCMEPMNFFADVTEEGAELVGPLQKPEYTEKTAAARLGIPLENIDIKMTRLGGGYGKRSYAHWVVEAALISQRMKSPVKLVYTREDDMTSGIYRPTYLATYRAALGNDNELKALHVNAGGIPESPLYANRFPAGTVDNYLAENWTVPSNITVGSFRAPSSNFMASAEQSFLDELAEKMGKDPIALRLELLERAKTRPVGEENDYDAGRYAGVLELVRNMSGWGKETPGVFRGVAAYFCHNSYAAQVMDLILENGKPKVDKVYCAVDCGILINPDAAINLIEGAVVDGLGNALFGSLTMDKGRVKQQNFDRYRMIRMAESPREIEVRFVESQEHPTGLGEPAFPPIFAALANALYKATGTRYYEQPYSMDKPPLVG